MTAPRHEILAEGCSSKRPPRPSMLPQQHVTIYALCNPNGEIRYIGKTRYTVGRRLSYHMSACRRSRLPSANWLRSLRERGLKPIAIELEKVALDGAWQEREQFWIAEYRARGARLLNLTEGGEGHHGRRIAGTEHAKKIAETHRRGSWLRCETCEAEFWRKPRDIKKGHDRFCSRSCYATSRKGVHKPIPAHTTMRGVEEAAKIRRAQTHCKRGHPLSGDNLFMTHGGSRGCKECRRLHKKTYRSKGGA